MSSFFVKRIDAVCEVALLKVDELGEAERRARNRDGKGTSRLTVLFGDCEDRV